jgi:phosphoribosyl 1,2-cyclic phosphodiesterase
MVVTPVAVPHDAREPVQFIFDTPGCRVGVLTDLGTITPHVVENYKECDGLLLEANHDVQMLAQGIYPPSLKRRVGGAYGHLSNHQSCSLLQQVNRQRLQTLVLGHISLQNNHKNLVAGAVADFEDELNTVIYADQEQGLDWQVIENHA